MRASRPSADPPETQTFPITTWERVEIVYTLLPGLRIFWRWPVLLVSRRAQGSAPSSRVSQSVSLLYFEHRDHMTRLPLAEANQPACHLVKAPVVPSCAQAVGISKGGPIHFR